MHLESTETAGHYRPGGPFRGGHDYTRASSSPKASSPGCQARPSAGPAGIAAADVRWQKEIRAGGPGESQGTEHGFGHLGMPTGHVRLPLGGRRGGVHSRRRYRCPGAARPRAASCRALRRRVFSMSSQSSLQAAPALTSRLISAWMSCAKRWHSVFLRPCCNARSGAGGVPGRVVC